MLKTARRSLAPVLFFAASAAAEYGGSLTRMRTPPALIPLLALSLLSAYFLHMAGRPRRFKDQQPYNFFALLSISVPFLAFAATDDVDLSYIAGFLEVFIAYVFWKRAQVAKWVAGKVGKPEKAKPRGKKRN